MRWIFGLVVVALGALSVLTRGATIVLLLAKGGDATHQLSKAFGGLAFGALLLLWGLSPLRKSRASSA